MHRLQSRARAVVTCPQINEDFFTRTASGGIVTIVASIVMVALFLSEFSACSAPLRPAAAADNLWRVVGPALSLSGLSPSDEPHNAFALSGLFLTVRTNHELNVDTSRGETIQIHVRARKSH